MRGLRDGGSTSGTALGESGRNNRIGLLPEEFFLIGAIDGGLAALTTATHRKLPITAELSATALHAGHRPSAPLAHPWLRLRLRVWSP